MSEFDKMILDGVPLPVVDQGSRDIISDAYDSTQTYTKGSYCLYDNKLYKCTTVITTPEAWTAAHWTESTIGTEFQGVNSSLTKKSESVSTQYSDENIVFIKSGNCCQIYINGIKNIPANSGTELCTIPVGYYPMFQDLIKWGLYDTSMTPIVRFYTNATRNKLFIYNYTSGSLTKANFHVNINYITKN